MRKPRPWFWEARGCWYIQQGKKQVRLDPDEAKAWALYARMMAAEGKPDEPGKLSIPVVVDLFLDPAIRPGRQATTMSNYRRVLGPFARAFKGRTIGSLTHQDAIRYCTKPPGWSDGYRHAIFADIATLCRWCRDRGYLAANPMAGAKNPWPRSGRTMTMDRGQFDRLLAVVPDPEFRLLLRVLYYTGCRPGEAYKLRAGHLDPTLSKATLGHKEHKTGHTTGKARPIHFPKDVMAELRRLADGLGPGEPILRNTEGRPWKDRNVATRFERACRRAGLPAGLVPYSTRHSFVTELVNKGENTALIAKLVGHVDDQMLQRVYFHEDERIAADIVERRASDVRP